MVHAGPALGKVWRVNNCDMGRLGEYILVVDDEFTIRESLGGILSDEGYVVKTAENGAEALALVEKGPVPDLLVTDIRMPELDGLSLISRAREKREDLPVLVLTGFGDKDTLLSLIRLGCDDLLHKPCQAEEVIEKVREALDKHRRKLADQTDLLRKNTELMRDLESYRDRFEFMRAEIENAVVIYHDLIGQSGSDSKLKVACRSRPFKELGGDFTDIRNTDKGCDILVADVAGHDLAASYHTVLIKAYFEENCRTGKSGEEFFTVLNRSLRENGTNERMVTALFFRVNLEEMTGRLYSAGHPRMLGIKQNSTRAVPVEAEGDILGLHERVAFQVRDIALSPGERFILYTDGISNARYTEGLTGKRRKLGEEGLRRLVEEHVHEPLGKLSEHVWNDVMRFCRHKQADDMLLLALEIPEGGAALRG